MRGLVCFALAALAVLGPQQASACEIAPVPVYFQGDSFVLDASAISVVEEIVDYAKASPAITYVSVEGYTDTLGEPDANLILSRKRADLVRDLLVARGLQADIIRLRALGETNPHVATGDEVREPLNSRVEIDFDGRHC